MPAVPVFTGAVVREPADTLGRGLTTVSLGTPDPVRAREQHAAYVRALERLGLAVTVLPPQPEFPDAHFVEDTAVLLPEIALIARPGAKARRGEEKSVAAALGELRLYGEQAAKGEAIRIVAPGTLDGGDVLVCGCRILVGIGTRTNAAGADQLAAATRPHGYEVRLVPLAAGLHLKSSVNLVAEETVIVTPAFADREELADLRRIVIPAAESHAANVLLINGTLLVPEGYPAATERLAGLGAPLISLGTSEFRKMDGGLTCLSLRF